MEPIMTLPLVENMSQSGLEMQKMHSSQLKNLTNIDNYYSLNMSIQEFHYFQGENCGFSTARSRDNNCTVFSIISLFLQQISGYSFQHFSIVIHLSIHLFVNVFYCFFNIIRYMLSCTYINKSLRKTALTYTITFNLTQTLPVFL